MTDEELVTAFVEGGRREALATLYDRHAAAVYDTAAAMTRDRADAEDLTHDVFVTAAEHLHELRDRSAVRAWLFSVLRRAVYGRSRRRARTVPHDPLRGDEMERPPDPHRDDPTERLVSLELAADVRAATRGLDERDRLVLELVARQRLAGEELATALGVSVSQSYVMVSRMRDRVERSLGAYAVARAGPPRCPELAAIVADWDGELTVLLRKRIARHVERCSTCEDTRRRTSVLSLVALAPAAVLPAGLRPRVLADAVGLGADDGTGTPPRATAVRAARSPSPPTAATRRAIRTAAVVLVLLLLGGLAVARTLDRTEPSGAAPAVVPPATGSSTTTTPTTAVSTTTPAPTTSSATTAPATMAPDGIDDPAPDPTDPGGGPDPSGPPPIATFDLVAAPAADDERPRVTLLTTPVVVDCARPVGVPVRAAVADASPIAAVRLDWRGPGEPGSTSMTRRSDGTWDGTAALDDVDGTWELTVTATDIAGNDGTASTTVVLDGCA